MKRNCEIPSINTMILKMIMKMKGWSMKKQRMFANLNPNGEVDFQTLIGETNFLILLVTKEDDT